MPERDGADKNLVDEDRRRSSRFSCGGQAKITWLPSNGIFVPGSIRDLSLHGCRIEIPHPIDRGVRAEIVVRVNAASFRAVGEVRAIRGHSGAGIEFVHLSAGGKDLLSDMIAQLAKLHAVMNKIKSARRETDAESFQRQLENGKRQAIMLSKDFPVLGAIQSAEKPEEEAATKSRGEAAAAEAEECLVLSVNLFV